MGCASSTMTFDPKTFDPYIICPTALSSYHKRFRGLIRNDLLFLTSVPGHSLELKQVLYTHSDGRTVNLIKLEGTIPIRSRNDNCPIVIWLPETFPLYSPPLVYVKPTQDMIIKQPHSCVDPSGKVSIPFLQYWHYTSHHFVRLIDCLGTVFGEDPPLCRRPIRNKAVEEAEDAIQVLGLSREHQD